MDELVSIIMPAYNTAQYIAGSIDSVLKQTYTNWELLIVDDCSTDNTVSVVSGFLHDPRIRFLQNAHNSGAALSRNYALREARGKWIAFLDSDDVWVPEKLEKQIAFMVHGGYHFSYTCYEIMDAQGIPAGVTVSGPGRITKRMMHCYDWIGCLTVMYDAHHIGLIQIANIAKCNDYAMWLKVCEKSDCYLLNESLAVYRRNRTGSIRSHQSIVSLIMWQYRFYREIVMHGCASSLIQTLRCIICGVYKKLRYTEKKTL